MNSATDWGDGLSVIPSLVETHMRVYASSECEYVCSTEKANVGNKDLNEAIYSPQVLVPVKWPF